MFPAIAETVPGFESVGFYGISAPKGTPPEIVEILNKAVGEALNDPKLVARLAELGGIPKPMTAGRIRQADRRRDREMAQGGRIRRRLGGLSLSFLTRFLDANRYPLRSKTLWARHCRNAGHPVNDAGTVASPLKA